MQMLQGLHPAEFSSGKKIIERHVYRFSQKPLINTEGQMNTDIQTQKNLIY